MTWKYVRCLKMHIIKSKAKVEILSAHSMNPWLLSDAHGALDELWEETQDIKIIWITSETFLMQSFTLTDRQFKVISFIRML